RQRSGRHVACRAGRRVPGVARASSHRRGRAVAGRAVGADPRRARGGEEGAVERPLRLISSNPLDQLARTLEALLVIASAPLTVEELAAAADDDPERVETALRLVGERYRE